MAKNPKLAHFGLAKRWQFALVGFIVALTSWLGVIGVFGPLDNVLRDMRFSFDNRPATGEVVLVEIDPKSLAHFGVWPWPRSLHAKAIDALVEYGAYNIAFDIDFSSYSTPENDAAMAKALDNAGGFVILASFAQQSGSDGQVTFNRPIEEFADNAWLASVNVAVDADGRVRKFPYSSQIGGRRVLSFPSALSGVESGKRAGFLIDYSIDAFAIDRISFLDVINGTVAPERLANKNVIIGAGAVELRDNFAVSRYGVISGPMLQVLATETLMQSRDLVSLDGIYSFGIIVLIGLFYLLLFQRFGIWNVFIAVAISTALTEIAGFYAQSQFGFLYDTGVIHAAQFLFLISSLAAELERRLGLYRRASQERAATQAILNQVITDNFDGVVVVDQNMQIRMASGFAEQLLNSKGEKNLVGSWAKERLPTELWQAVASTFDKSSKSQNQSETIQPLTLEQIDGSEQYLEYVVTRSIVENNTFNKQVRIGQRDEQVIACLTFRDVTERLKSAKKIEYIAHHDILTDALMRVKFADEISNLLDNEVGLTKGISVGALDLHRFKQVNETLGHVVGDQVLVQVVQRIRQSGVAFVGRLGGHSFVFCTAVALGPEELEEFCCDLISSLCEPYQLDEHRVIVGASIGVTDSFISGPIPDILLAHADMALSNVGSGSRKSYGVYSHELEEAILRKQDVEAALRIALEGDELWVAYQPQMCLRTGNLLGVEALVRWEHPEWGMVTPDQFIPVAEETGLIVDVGQWILERACSDAKKWPVPIKLAVNVSPLQFEFSDVKAGVALALEKSGLSPDRLDVEITESNFVDQSSGIIETLKALQSHGIGVALDDFGTGYSSLSYLSQLPIDKIKVDQSFVRKLPGDTETGAIVQSILDLGEALNKKIVAEGIETKEQADFLNKGGAQIGQGYLFGRPMNDVELRGFMLHQFWQDPNEAKAG